MYIKLHQKSHYNTRKINILTHIKYTIKLIHNNKLYLYIMGQEVVVRVADGESNPSAVFQGVRQGCLISPVLFSVYIEIMTKEAMEDVDEGVEVGGELLKDVRFADDQAMVAKSDGEPEQQM